MTGLKSAFFRVHYPSESNGDRLTISRGIKFAHANIGKTETITTFPYFCAFLLKRYLTSIVTSKKA